jgi:membrane protein insertase Oxa1/YidC/SpoIIIJ
MFLHRRPFTNVILRLPRFPPLTINKAVMADAAKMAILMATMEQIAEGLKQP